MRARTLIFILLASFAPNIFGQALTYTPPAAAAYLLSGGAWSAWSAALGADPLPYVPPAVGLYCSADGTTWTPCTGGGGGGSFTALTGDATSTSTGGATEVVGLLNHALPSLTTGYLNYTGSAWALSPLSVTFDQVLSGTSVGEGLVVGSGTVLTWSSGGFINANEINGSVIPAGILLTTDTGSPNYGCFSFNNNCADGTRNGFTIGLAAAGDNNQYQDMPTGGILNIRVNNANVESVGLGGISTAAALFTGPPQTAPSGQVSVGGTIIAASNCNQSGTLTGVVACWVASVNGAGNLYIPLF